ncbi:hypothetical protein ACH4SP_37055 [Streptomyces sp. NPDC021093]|uniref:hypothetical protein n=1 Tax=Streptomyces sp. NPDC021093 TaxID=3365112 RepID=UPI0037B8FE9A
MGMTMRVYEIDSRTGKVVRERGRVVVGLGNGRDATLVSSAYPPCQCSRCRVAAKSRKGSD